MISQFFILSARGDTIINADFRHDLVRNTPEIFFRNVKLAKGDAPPIFNIDGISFMYLKKSTGLYLVMTTRGNTAPSFMMEILNRVAKIIKDFCGILSEEAIRKNFTLIYEVIDEMLDFGYPQLTSTELVKKYVVNEPVPVDSANLIRNLVCYHRVHSYFDYYNTRSVLIFSTRDDKRILNLQFVKESKSIGGLFKPNTVSSQAVTAPISMSDDNKNKKNEIFVDIYEKISITFNSTGYVINSSIEGCIQMKSYLQGNPEIKLALNDNLILGKGHSSTPALDDYNFHECVNSNEFDMNKIVRIKPPEGEFVAMNYRVTGEFEPPFRFFTYIEEPSNYRLELTLRIKGTFPKEFSGNNVTIKFNVPRNISNVHTEIPKGVLNQEAEFQSSTNSVRWFIKKFQGGAEHAFKAKISLQTNATTTNARKEIGPISMTFEIPMYNLSTLQIKYLRMDETDSKGSQAHKWVRYITQSSSYICRV